MQFPKTIRLKFKRYRALSSPPLPPSALAVFVRKTCFSFPQPFSLFHRAWPDMLGSRIDDYRGLGGPFGIRALSVGILEYQRCAVLPVRVSTQSLVHP